MAENLEIKLQVDTAESGVALDEFGLKLQKVTTDVKTMQDSLIGDPAKDKTFGTEARARVETLGNKIQETEDKVKKFRKLREKPLKEDLLGQKAVNELNNVSDAIQDVTDSAEDFAEIIDEAEAGQAIFGKEITDEITEMDDAIAKLGTTTNDAITALSDEGFSFDAETFAPVNKVNEEIATLEKLIESTRTKLATAVDNQAFGADLTDEIRELEETLFDAELAIADSKKKIASGPKGPFPVKVTEQMKEFGGVLGDLLPRELQSLQKGFLSAQKGTASFSKGLKGMKKALISSGIGALVVLVGELVANWENIVGWMNAASDASKQQVEDADAMVAATKERSDYLNDTTNIMLLQGKTEEEIAEMKRQALDDEVEAARVREEAIKKQGEEQVKIAERNQKIAMGILGFMNLPITILLGAIDALTYGLAQIGVIEEATTLAEDFMKGGAKLLGFDAEAAKEEAEKANEEAAKSRLAMEEKQAGEILRRKREQEAEQKRNAEAWKKHLADQQKFLDQLLLQEQEYGKSQDELAVMRLKREQEEQMERAKALKLSNEDLLRLEKQHAQELEDLEKSQEERRKKIAEDEQKKVLDATKSDFDLKVEQVNAQYAELIALAEKYGMDTTALEAKREAELRAMRLKAQEEEVADINALRRELELLNMTEEEAEFARKRDKAKAEMEERLATAGGNLELEKMIREQYRLEMEAISNEEKDSYLASRQEMFNATMDFARQVNGAYQSIQDVVKANMEAEMIAAKERGASEAELEKLQKQHEKRERQFAITNILIQQGQAVASAIAGASAAAAATGPAAPFALPGYIITATTAIATAFAQVKQIMNKAKASNLPSGSSSSGGGGGRGTTDALTPNLVGDLANENIGQRSEGEGSFKTYVVASDVEGENADYGNIVQNASL